ncbi:hypothetical protein CDL12_00450 [Handroanthus impetiginosus]|uniref:Uncharacterized protein n=1 Tax=Handroanthus impetiginosus TaxID=429701 RepID=A0A2G9IAK0_9LAMI|nr:hypothetical protein CDL12_00450 [Handroanthus impetiginosus]
MSSSVEDMQRKVEFARQSGCWQGSEPFETHKLSFFVYFYLIIYLFIYLFLRIGI